MSICSWNLLYHSGCSFNFCLYEIVVWQAGTWEEKNLSSWASNRLKVHFFVTDSIQIANFTFPRFSWIMRYVFWSNEVKSHSIQFPWVSDSIYCLWFVVWVGSFRFTKIWWMSMSRTFSASQFTCITSLCQ